jgi:ankyrin repeat protein
MNHHIVESRKNLLSWAHFLIDIILLCNFFRVSQAGCRSPSAGRTLAPVDAGASILEKLCQSAASGDIESIRTFCREQDGPSILMGLDTQGSSPAHYAARHNQAEVLRVLCEIGGRTCLFAKDSLKRTPAHVAASCGFTTFLCTIKELGATETYCAFDKMARTPAHLAAMQGHDSVLGLLKEGGADLSAKDNLGR